MDSYDFFNEFSRESDIYYKPFHISEFCKNLVVLDSSYIEISSYSPSMHTHCVIAF